MENQSKMLKNDWPTVRKKLFGLWPTTAQRNLTTDMEALWIKMLGERRVDEIFVSLEILAGSSPYFPKPFDILKRLTPERKSQAPIQQCKKAEEERILKEIDEVNRFCSKLTEDEKKHAASTILRNNPVKAISLMRIPLTHPGWKAMIYRLLKEGKVDEDQTVSI